jgi:hypothetical protein
VAHPYNPSYSRSRDREDYDSRSVRQKIYVTPFQLIKAGCGSATCHHSYSGSVTRRTEFKADIIFEK